MCGRRVVLNDLEGPEVQALPNEPLLERVIQM